MKIYLVEGVNHVVPGLIQTLHLEMKAANEAALDLVQTISQHLDDKIEAPSDPAAWKEYLRSVQTRCIEEGGGDAADLDDEKLADEAGCYVTIREMEAPSPRVVVSINGGLVEDISADVELDAYVIDYDVEGGEESEIIPIPQGNDVFTEGFMRGEAIKVNPEWIDSAIHARDTHDYQGGSEEE